MSYSLQSVTLSAFVGWANKFTTETEEPKRAKFLVFILVPHPEDSLLLTSFPLSSAKLSFQYQFPLQGK